MEVNTHLIMSYKVSQGFLSREVYKYIRITLFIIPPPRGHKMIKVMEDSMRLVRQMCFLHVKSTASNNGD